MRWRVSVKREIACRKGPDLCALGQSDDDPTFVDSYRSRLNAVKRLFHWFLWEEFSKPGVLDHLAQCPEGEYLSFGS